MSERASNNNTASTSWYLDAGAGYPVVPGRVGAHIPRSPAPRSQRLRPGPGGITGNGARRGSRSGVTSGRDLRSPKWYRIVVLTASGVSGIATVAIGVAKGVIG